MGRRVRGRVVAAALAVGLLPTAALAAPAAFDAWDSYQENRQTEALVRKSRPAVDALRRIEVAGLAPCPGRADNLLHGTCLASDTLQPIAVAGRVRDQLRAVGATDVTVECFHSKLIDHCYFAGRLHGVHVGGYSGPRLEPGRLYGVQVMLHVEPAPGPLLHPAGGTPVPVP